MKTVDELAKEYVLRNVGSAYEQIAITIFKDAFNLAQQMIPVEKELPPELFVVLLYNKENVFVTGHYHNSKFINISNGNEEEVTHWRPIFVL